MSNHPALVIPFKYLLFVLVFILPGNFGCGVSKVSKSISDRKGNYAEKAEDD